MTSPPLNAPFRAPHRAGFVAVFAAFAVVSGAAGSAGAAEWPSRPIKIIAPSTPGGAADTFARLLAEFLPPLLHVPVVVDNRAGAGGLIGEAAGAHAEPDGYTFVTSSVAYLAVAPAVSQNPGFDPIRDFAHIAYLGGPPNVFVVNPKLGVSTLPQLIALAKKEPDQVSIAVTGAGRLTDLTGLLLEDRAGVQLLRVPYNGGPAAALADVGSGRVSMIIEGYSGILGSVKAGQVKIIAVAAHKRLPEFPNVPTVAETIPDFYATGWQVLLAPLGTPKPIVDKVSTDLAKVVNDPEFRAGDISTAFIPDFIARRKPPPEPPPELDVAVALAALAHFQTASMQQTSTAKVEASRWLSAGRGQLLRQS